MEHEPTRGTPRMPTGIAGLDDIADGGLPRGGVTVVLGGVGTGKTTFGMQVLAKGAGEHHEPGILVTFEESAVRVMANTTGFGWGGEALKDMGVHAIDAQLSQSVEQSGDFDLVGLLAIVAAKAKQVGARRIVFDGIDVLLSCLGNAASVRREAFRLRDWVNQSGLSAIVTAKADASGQNALTDFDFLQFMADCVVMLHHRVVQGVALRFVRIAKYRGAAHSTNEFPFVITEAGLEVSCNTSVGLSYPVSMERVSSGVERLDAMLCGGYHRGSSILITGAPGTAKTSLSAAFALAAARRGERTLYVSFDEAPEQIVRNVASIGLQLGPHIEEGTLVVKALRGRAASPEAHVARIRALLGELQPQHLVVDPLSALFQHGFDQVSEGAALQILDVAKSRGVTMIFTSLLGTAAALNEQTPINVSTIADTWMHVSNVSQGGERNRTLTIVKSRGTGHSNQVRELVLTRDGITLADVYAVGGEVLLGTLRWEKEAADQRAREATKSDALVRKQRAELALAKTKFELAALAQRSAIQEEELAQLAKRTTAEADTRVDEDQERLQRRRSDQTMTSAPPAGGADQGAEPSIRRDRDE
jgi:circadian clock protein KaiC